MKVFSSDFAKILLHPAKFITLRQKGSILPLYLCATP
jgi:hypothetical protein